MQRFYQDTLKYVEEIGQIGAFSLCNSHFSVLFAACVNSRETVSWNWFDPISQFQARKHKTKH